MIGKLLKEQFFIDILVMILKESVSKNELELYENYKKHQEQNGGIPSTKMARVDTLLSTEGVEKAINKRPILGDYARRELEPQSK